MINFYRNKRPILFVLFALVAILPFTGKLTQKTNNNAGKKNELYKSELAAVNSMKTAVSYVDSVYRLTYSGRFDTSLYAQAASHFTKERFYHGVSHYTLSENWIAYLLSKTVWSHFSVIVDPDDILNHSDGLCSQQTIVFMELLKRKKINVRSVGLGYKEGPGHFLSEVHYGGSWHLYDVTMEPQWVKVVGQHRSFEYYLSCKDSLYLVYKSKLDKPVFDKIIERVVYGKVNEFPAKKMLFFHKITLAITYFLPFFLLFLSFRFKAKNRQQIVQHTGKKESYAYEEQSSV